MTPETLNQREYEATMAMIDAEYQLACTREHYSQIERKYEYQIRRIKMQKAYADERFAIPAPTAKPGDPEYCAQVEAQAAARQRLDAQNHINRAAAKAEYLGQVAEHQTRLSTLRADYEQRKAEATVKYQAWRKQVEARREARQAAALEEARAVLGIQEETTEVQP